MTSTPFSFKFNDLKLKLVNLTGSSKGFYHFEGLGSYRKQGNSFGFRKVSIKFLPTKKKYWLLNSIVLKGNFVNGDVEVKAVAHAVTDALNSRFEGSNPKKLREHVTFFLNALREMDFWENGAIEVPTQLINEITDECIRLCKSGAPLKIGKGDSPYYSNPNFGQFWMSDLGELLPEEFSKYGIKI